MEAEEISGFVLAGGLSSRLGQDKVLLAWNGQTLLDHAVGQLQRVCSSVRVCADRKDLTAHLVPAEPLIRDALPGAGPLAGIVAALEESQTQWNFFLAVDLPLVPVELLQALAARVQNGHADVGILCVLPQVDGMPQPLCGLYHRSLVGGLRSALNEGKYKILLALENAVHRAEESEESGLETREPFTPVAPASRVELFDAQALSIIAKVDSVFSFTDWFLNINTPQDWRRANDLNSM